MKIRLATTERAQSVPDFGRPGILSWRITTLETKPRLSIGAATQKNSTVYDDDS
jgi:hypothetical protein